MLDYERNNAIRVAILTISDTRTLHTDKSGQLLEEELAKQGYTVSGRKWVKDDIYKIRNAIKAFEATNPFAIITTGGTGIAQRDLTYEALHSYIHQEIPGFGELFRTLSYEEIGSRAMASRAFSGFSENGTLFFCLPGSIHACKMAMEKLILPEIPHLFLERTK